MHLLRVAFRNVQRRKWSFLLSDIILSMAAMTLLLSIAHLSGVRQRVDFVQQQDLYKEGFLQLTVENDGDCTPAVESKAVSGTIDIVKNHPGVLGVGYKQSCGVPLVSGASDAALRTELMNPDYGLALPHPPVSEGRWFSDEDWTQEGPVVPVVVNERLRNRLQLNDTVA